MVNKSHLSCLSIKVKVIRKSSYGPVCGLGVRIVIKPESATRGDEFAFHFRVGRPPLPLMSEIDCLVTVEPDKCHRDLAL